MNSTEGLKERESGRVNGRARCRRKAERGKGSENELGEVSDWQSKGREKARKRVRDTERTRGKHGRGGTNEGKWERNKGFMGQL